MMKKIGYFSTIFFVLVLLGSCNSKQKEEARADEKLNEIEQLINANAFNEAKSRIDSIHLEFPRLVNKRKIAAALADTITRRESARTLAYCDSILPKMKLKLDSLQVNFRFEKNDKYQEIGNYVYKSQITEQNTGRNYLKCYVDEKANFYLVSNVTGSKLNHRSLKLSTANMFVITDTTSASKADFHSFTVDGAYYETLTFVNKDENGVAAFVSEHKNERIKVSLIGIKKFDYYLTDGDKKAISETFEFWVIKRDIIQLERESLKCQMKIGNINLRHSI